MLSGEKNNRLGPTESVNWDVLKLSLLGPSTRALLQCVGPIESLINSVIPGILAMFTVKTAKKNAAMIRPPVRGKVQLVQLITATPKKIEQ